MRFAMRGRPLSGLFTKRPTTSRSCGQRSFVKMTAPDKHLKRGASVQILQPGLPTLTSFETELNFAESFTTFTAVKSKKLDDIKETVECPNADSVIETVKSILELKNRTTSTLTLERLVKEFTKDYESLNQEEKMKLFIHLASKHFINETDLR